MCAFWSTTQCDLQLYIWFPWQQKKIFHVFLRHVVTVCLYVFVLSRISQDLIQMNVLYGQIES